MHNRVAASDPRLISVDDVTRDVVVDLVLLHEFHLYDLSALTEVFRMANEAQQNATFSWHVVGLSREAVCSSLGCSVTPTHSLNDVTRGRNVLVLGGAAASQVPATELVRWVRGQFRQGAIVGCIGSACHVLALAGLLANRRCSVHWEDLGVLRELYPDVSPHQRLFDIDGRVISCSGGRGSIDLALTLVSRMCGEVVGRRIADRLNCDRMRDHFEQQHGTLGIRNERVCRTIALMNANIEQPVPPDELARLEGVSLRQLQRLFRTYALTSLAQCYLTQRLTKARRLLEDTDMSVSEIALATGFETPSHFAQRYRAKFQCTPSRNRGTFARRPVKPFDDNGRFISLNRLDVAMRQELTY